MIGRWKRRGNHLATAKLAVKRHLPWYAQFGLAIVLVCMLAGMGIAVYRYGEQEGRRDPSALLAVQGASQQSDRLQAELQANRQKLMALEQQLRLEMATRETLSRQLGQLQNDNSGLREQIAFYESLLTKTDRAPALAIDQLRVEALTPGQYRLRAILVQGQSSQEPFKGEVDFQLVVERAGRRVTMTWPERRIPLNVSRYTRLEKETDLGVDAKLKQVEMRVYAVGDNRVKLSRSYDVKG
ncbi:hypothetical protein GCM10007907_00930 [Chitinimonas prasina]|uniref:Uncharacterized protein n=1 Tax=Chitinimonas prasina TaxID=1434937 RepID=A0ABQ5YCH7_9NEIS|nr:DUF6776 family protein [Chitinimonas prasina]GLR11303.1 hypothetical protein GCM10007907_00930 [Chitinimonas prasina]